MFTGLIERIGRVKAHSASHDRLTIELVGSADLQGQQTILPAAVRASQEPPAEADDGRRQAEFFEGLRVGDSVAVDGVCLTVVRFDSPAAAFDVNLAPETLARSNLGALRAHSLVNLERALASATRFGGHFVQGHIDKTGTIVSRAEDGDSVRLTIEYESEGEGAGAGWGRYLIPKGYVTVDGISLTITAIEPAARRFSVMLIPHTQRSVTLALKSPAQTVNLEFDMLVKSIVNVLEQSLNDLLVPIVHQALRAILPPHLLPPPAAHDLSLD